MRSLAGPLLALLLLFAASAQSWATGFSDLGIRIETGGPPLPQTPFVALPEEALPDSWAAIGTAGIVKALLVAPTDRYGHAVLGDGIEAGGLRVITAGGLVLEILLPPEAVFEDLRPRLLDLTGDGSDEVLVIKA